MLWSLLSLIWGIVTIPWSFACFLADWPWLFVGFTAAGFFSVMTYVVPVLIQILYHDKHEVNLKEKYGATWALVTGGSEGIGRGIVEKLVSQKINVVIVARDDPHIHAFHKELTEKNPSLKFIKCPVDLSSGDYMLPIKAATRDIQVQLVFNNAGYIIPGLFTEISAEANVRNHECNAAAPVKISHHFCRELIDAGKPGLIAFTSSSAGFVPTPLSALYASTKSFLTLFGTSLAPEVKPFGIDVVVVHPSPMNTAFFEAADSLDVLKIFKKLAAPPSVIADVICSSAGRWVVRDQGAVSIIFRLFLKTIDLNFFSQITTWFGHMSGDYKNHKAKLDARLAAKRAQ